MRGAFVGRNKNGRDKKKEKRVGSSILILKKSFLKAVEIQ